MLTAPPAWVRQAACLGKATADHDPWHPPEKPPSIRRKMVAEALEVCIACPVQVACGRYGLELLATDGGIAVYGGLTPEQLRDLARMIGRPARLVAQHGTRARYVNAKCRCEACRAANARDEHARRTAKASEHRECRALTSYGRLCRQPARKGSVFCVSHAIAGAPTSAYEFR